ncbi:MAG: UDP-N-acetylmuramate:L-alanyl-gamma-D-glutamyl-meso-diaminopimelate ligase [Betaproteobacteria bacterium]|nr:UDP-N-acetylmuramate:L-alanyl-gamma-D-glutamyl-meso-diaminopimelate ligase [Betaproteobacteria bacterium]
MHIHIIGICGTFMGGVAQLARAKGYTVTGCDAQVYPPMSDQLAQAGINLIEGFAADQLALKPDLWVVGNVARRGLPLIEEILNRKLPMVSGPQFMADHVLGPTRLAAVSGTHGKTTTSALLAYLLDACGLSPGFLIGGVPENFGVSARSAADGAPFVIEADEYDTAFFDKRSKFLHYRAEVAILNNLEFDHADIFADLAAIETQFHHWVRTLPSAGALWVKAKESALERVLAKGHYSPVYRFDHAEGAPARDGSDTTPEPSARLRLVATTPDDSGRDRLEVWLDGEPQGIVTSPLWGDHNRANLAAALGAAVSLGAPIADLIAAVPGFRGIKRRMQLRGERSGVRIFDDFAHHPTAIATTLQGLQRHQRPGGRILAVLEPRSNTMKMGVMRARLAESLAQAHAVFGFSGGLDWSLGEALAPLGSKAQAFDSLAVLIEAVCREAQAGDDILVMSNGAFGGIHERLLATLAACQSPNAHTSNSTGSDSSARAAVG